MATSQLYLPTSVRTIMPLSMNSGGKCMLIQHDLMLP